MNFYERIFGSGPRGLLISVVLLLVCYALEQTIALPKMIVNDLLRYSLITGFSLLGVSVIIWSVKSLPPQDRGRKLVTSGAFRYFRHPLYAAFLLFLNVGFALLMNNWIYLFWALLLFPVWSVNVRSEEQLMNRAFGKEYQRYCAKTDRFIPRFWGKD